MPLSSNSVFISLKLLFAFLFNISLPRTAHGQMDVCDKLKKDELHEGDLVFFRTGKDVFHVGLFIRNNRFVHASTSNGVLISDLDEEYWTKHFLNYGRLNRKLLKD